MTGNLKVYEVNNRRTIKEVAPLIPFPRSNKEKSAFHKEELCSEILHLLERYIFLAKEQGIGKKMSEEQELIYFNLQEKMLLLDKYDINLLLKQPIVELLHTIESNHELESFMLLLDQFLIPEENAEFEWEVPEKGKWHK